MRRILKIVALCAVILVSMTSCRESYKDIAITSCSVRSIKPTGLRSAEAVLAIGIHNPTVSFTVTGFDGSVKEKGTEIIHLTAGGVQVERKCDMVYEVPVTAQLTGSLNILTISKVLTTKNLEDFSADISAKVSLRNGIGKTITMEDVPLSSLIEGI